MSEIAIRVENLSKRYRIGLKEEIHDTFAGALTDFVKRPVRNLHRLRRLFPPSVTTTTTPKTSSGL